MKQALIDMGSHLSKDFHPLFQDTWNIADEAPFLTRSCQDIQLLQQGANSCLSMSWQIYYPIWTPKTHTHQEENYLMTDFKL